jgi:folate-binding protein YgfZ
MPQSFGNDREAWMAVREGVALWDRSHWGVLQLRGEDRLRFLHNQTTNDIQRLQAGQGCDTVFVTSTGRTIDLATAYVTQEEVLILVSPNRRQQLMEWMDRFIFPMDRVELADLSAQQAIFTLIGAQSDRFLQSLGIAPLSSQPEASHTSAELGGTSVRVAVGSGLPLPGYTLIVPVESAVSLWSTLTDLGAVPLGDRVWEQLRIQQGRPVCDRELTEDYNPLEAGLWRAISFTKGCYIGQETIARLNTYKGVKQRLWGIKLNQWIEPKTSITLDGEKVGILTSCTDTEAGFLGLAYVRTKAGGAGLTVEIEAGRGELVAVPFLTHEYYQPSLG